MFFKKTHSSRITVCGETIVVKQHASARKREAPLVSIITPAYNAARTIEKTLDSILAQSIDSSKIEIIVVNDCSTDETADIVSRYLKSHPSVSLVNCAKNHGRPPIPRNIGTAVSRGTYLMYLDADDWIDEKAVETLADILEESGDDYAVGRTIRVRDNSEETVGAWQSYIERRNVKPLDVPYIYYYLGPQSRMVRASVVKDNNIEYIDLPFSEDKFFFGTVLSRCKSIATTQQTICYLNRKTENKGSAIHRLKTIDKRNCDLVVIDAILAGEYSVPFQKAFLGRIYEYDIMKMFTEKPFLNAKDKTRYHEVLAQAMDKAAQLDWDIREVFEEDLNRVAWDLFAQGRVDDFDALFAWHKNVKDKQHHIDGAASWLHAELPEGRTCAYQETLFINALASINKNDDAIILAMELYGPHAHEIENISITDFTRVGCDIAFPLTWLNETVAYIEVTPSLLINMGPGRYKVIANRFGRRSNIRVLSDEERVIRAEDARPLVYLEDTGALSVSASALDGKQGREFIEANRISCGEFSMGFYVTIMDNLGFVIAE